MKLIRSIVVLASVLALPHRVLADSDGYYCNGARYLAYQFGLDGGPEPHTLHIIRFTEDGVLFAPLQVSLPQFQVHGLRCRAGAVDVASFDSVYTIQFQESGEIVRRSVQPLAGPGQLPEWSRAQRNLARLSRPAGTLVPQRTALAALGTRRYVLEITASNVVSRPCTSLVVTRVVAQDEAGRELGSHPVFRGETGRECGETDSRPLTPNDTSGILAAILGEYRTPNGPIVQIAGTIACGDTRYTGPARLAQGVPCRSAVIDSAIVAYTRNQSVSVVDVGAPLPVCRWNDGPSTGPVGLRIDLMAPSVINGEVRAGILARCSGSRRGEPSGFLHSVVYEVKVVDGRWRVSRLVSGLIT